MLKFVNQTTIMVTIILPTYNEKENISDILQKIFAVFKNENINGNVIVVDDNSPDGTGKIVENLKKDIYRDGLDIICRNEKMGLGSAYIAGFKKALDFGAEFIFEMDADLSHSPDDIPRFLRAIQDYDLVIGSRYIKGGNVDNWNKKRIMISKGGTLYAKKVLNIPINDLTSGFKCFRRSILNDLDLNNVKSDGYSFQIELTYRAFRKGYKIKEIPITFVDRQVGKSKFSKNILFEAALVVWRLRFGK